MSDHDATDDLDRVAIPPEVAPLFGPSQFGLREPLDLVWKLERELIRMRSEPSHTDHAFNFFVTAEHILDWLHPGNAGKRTRDIERKDRLLATVSHLASGAKHFSHLHTHHKSVRGMDQPGLVKRVLHRALGVSRLPDAPLVIELDEPIDAGGETRWEAIALAKRVLDYWMNRLEVPAERRTIG